MRGENMKPDNRTASICGLFCGTCTQYPMNCHGCLSDKLTEHCITCRHGFRDCAKLHNVTRCYECSEFPCHRLEDFSHDHYENGICHHKNVIKDLTYMKENDVEKWIEKQTLENTCPECGNIIFWMKKNSHSC